MKIAHSHTTPQFEEDFLALQDRIQRKAKRRILFFEENCFSSVLDTHKLKGRLNKFWSFSIDNDYRIIFRFLARGEVIYYRIGPHRIYKELERLF